ncbi:MAG: hypothetical protein PWQ57_555 [Desulfovibrionales bacterium]|nr:hypothetical protein [Desulfovibrionales bacterium]
MMRRKRAAAILSALCLALFLAFAGGAYAEAMVQTKCPVMGYKPNEKIYTDYKGKRIYFCCESCPETFKKNPDKYMEKLKQEGVQLQDAPASN